MQRRSRALSSSSGSERDSRSYREDQRRGRSKALSSSSSSDERGRQQRLRKAGRMKCAPLLDVAIVEAVYSAMAGKAQKRASRHWLEQFAKYENAGRRGAIKTEKFIKCLARMGVALDNKKEFEALANCFQCSGGGRDSGSSGVDNNEEKRTQFVDYAAFVDFACNVRDSEKLSEIAESLRESISKYDGKKQSSSSYNLAARLEKLDRHKRGWITSTQFERAFDREDRGPSFRLSTTHVSTLLDRFEYEYESEQLGVDYMQFAQWLQPLLHLDVKKVHERVKTLIEDADKKHGWKLDEVFKAMDDDRNGEIDAIELKEALLDMGLPLTDAQIRCLADEYDVDGDGKIQYNEFISLFSPADKKRGDSKRKGLRRDNTGNNSDTGSTTAAAKRRKNRPKRNVRNSFSWGITKAFARKQAAGRTLTSFKAKKAPKGSDATSSSGNNKSDGPRKKKGPKQQKEIDSTSSDEDRDIKRSINRKVRRHKQNSDSSEAEKISSSSASDNQGKSAKSKGNRSISKRNSTSKRRALSNSSGSEQEGGSRGQSDKRKKMKPKDKSKPGKKKALTGTDDESKEHESSEEPKASSKDRSGLKRSEKVTRASSTRRRNQLPTSDTPLRSQSSQRMSRLHRHVQSPRRHTTRRSSPRRRRHMSRSRSVKPRRAIHRNTGISGASDDGSSLSDNNGSSSGLDVEHLRRLQQKGGRQIKRHTRSGHIDSTEDEMEEEGETDEQQGTESGKGREEEISRSDEEYHKHLKRSLRRAFDFFDLDQTSTIDKRELNHVLRALGHEFTSKELQAEMASADLDQNGQLDFYEFVAFVKRQLSQKTYLLSQQREMEICQSFQSLDTDKNGSLDEQEFEYLIYKVLQVELSVEEQDALLDFVDKDADGLISEEEFVAFIKKLETLHRKHAGKGSWKKQKRFLESLDVTSQLAYSGMKKLVRGAPMDIDRNLLMFFGIPSNFRPAISSAATCRTLQGNTMEHVLSFPSPQTIEALALDTRLNDQKGSSWFALTGLDSNSSEYMMLQQAENVEAQAIVSLKRAAGVPKPFDTREDDVVKRCVHVCLFQEQEEVSSASTSTTRRHRKSSKAGEMVTTAKVIGAGTVVGNVHEIPVYWHAGEEDVWEFSKKSTKQDKYKFLVRTNAVNDHLYLLVEFIIHLRINAEEHRSKKRSKSSKDRKVPKETDNRSDDERLHRETREMVCCWCKIPVRQLLAKRSEVMRRKEKLWGGTANAPVDIEQDEILRRRTGWRALTNMFTKPSPPLMGIKSVPIDSLAEDLQQFVRKMPPIVIAPFVSLPILAEYMTLVRKTLASVTSSSSVMSCEPALKLLPKIVDDHVALSVFRKLFDAEVAVMKPGEERHAKFQELVLRMWPSFVHWHERLPPSLLPPAAKPASLPLLSNAAAIPPLGVTALSTSDSNAHQTRFNLLQTTAAGKLRMQDARVSSAPFHIRENPIYDITSTVDTAMRVIRRIRRLAQAWIVYRYRTAEQQMDFLRAPVDGVALSEGFPVNGFRLMVALAGCSLVAPLIHLARTETLRHLFNVAAGLLAGAFVFDIAVLHTIGTAAVVYVLMLVAPRKLVGRIVLPLLLAYLVGIHYYREFYSPDIVWDSAQMILTLKLSSVAINYSDGGLLKEKKTPTMLKNELQDIPAVIPYFGFIFFFPTYLAGPAFEYKDYIYWMKDIRMAPFLVHLRNLFVLVVSAAGFFASLQFPVEEIDSPDFYPDYPWALRCLMMCIPVVLFRFRFYLAWSLAEAASAAAGVGYVQATGKWNGITNNDLLCVEVPTNFRVAINNWNIGVARWINTYIYQRVGLSKSGKSGLVSTMASFFISALWHGLSPGYYLFFLLGGIYIEVGKHMRRRLRAYFHYTEDRKAHPHAIFLSYFNGTSHPLAFIYDIAGLFLTWVAMQYAGVAFEIMDVRRCIAIWRSWYFLPHVVSIGLLVFFNLFPQRRSATTSTKKTQ